MFSRTGLLLAAFAAMVVAPGHAGMVVYTTSGIFDGSVPLSVFTPGGPASHNWSLRMTVDEFPVVTPGSDWFAVSPAEFEYTVDSVPQPLSPSAIYFYNAAEAGMFTVEFGSPSNFFGFSGPVMFSGDVASPRMLTGLFVDDNSAPPADGVFVNDLKYQSLEGTIVTGVATPEATSWSLTLLGGVAVALRLRHRRR